MLLLVDVLCQRLMIDERVRRSLPEARPLFGQSEIAAVRSKHDVAMKSAHGGKGAFQIIREGGVEIIADEAISRRPQTSKEHDVVRVTAFADLHRPCGTALGVTWCQMGGHASGAEGDSFAVADDVVDMCRLEREARAKSKVVQGTILDLRLITRADIELRAGASFQLGESAGVIEVCLAIEEDLDVLDIESQDPKIALDERNGLGEAAVEKDQSLFGADRVRGDLGRPDVIDVSGDAERRHRLVPCLLFGRQGSASKGQKKREEKSGRSNHGAIEAERGLARHVDFSRGPDNQERFDAPISASLHLRLKLSSRRNCSRRH